MYTYAKHMRAINLYDEAGKCDKLVDVLAMKTSGRYGSLPKLQSKRQFIFRPWLETYF